MNIHQVFFKLLLIAVSVFIFVSCNGKQKPDEVKITDIHNPQTADGISPKEEKNLPVISFECLEYDFGKVLQGERLSYSFKFKNTGKSNLIIYNTEASCGCTTSTPPKAPVRPGESEAIKVIFDSKTQKGKVEKVVVVAANTYPVQTVLRIKAEVVIP